MQEMFLPKVSISVCLYAGIFFTNESSAQSFLRTMGIPERQERGLVLHRSASGAIYLGGNVGDSALVQRIDVNGELIWSRTFKVEGQQPNMVYHFSDAPDGSIIGCGNGVASNGEPGEAFHFKFNEAGEFQWIRRWSDPSAYDRAIFANGSDQLMLLGCYREQGAGTTWTDYFQSIVNPATGMVIWVSDRQDLYHEVPYVDDATSAVRHDDEFYLTGRIYTNGSSASTCRINLTKVNELGQHVWTRYLLYSNAEDRRMYGTDIISQDDSLLISYYGNISGSNALYTVGLIRTDAEGNVAWARDYDILGSESELSTKVIATSFGYVLAGRTLDVGYQRFFLLAVSLAGEVLWSRVYGPVGAVHVAPHVYLKNLIGTDDGFMFTLAELSGSDNDVLLGRTDLQGRISCADVQDIEVITTVLPTVYYDTQTMPNAMSMALDDDIWVVGTPLLTNDCDVALDLGSDTATCAPLTLSPSVPGAHYVWQDGSTSDDFLVVTPGVYWVSATVNCCTVTDTVSVTASEAGGQVDGEALVPNVFTPNADGRNDRFGLAWGGQAGIELTVYDRWGVRVFHDTGADPEWDGRYMGRPVPEGTYYYRLRMKGSCDGQVLDRTGFVTLLR